MAISDVIRSSNKAHPEVKRLQTIIDKQCQQIEDMRAAKFKLKVGKRKATGKKTFVRVIIPDTHGAHIDQAAASAFLNDLELLKPKQVVYLGDHVDCAGFLSLHHVAGFLPDCDYTYEQDVAAANDFLDQVQSRVGNIESYYCEGNHEIRVAKQIMKMTLRNPKDSAYLNRLFGIEAVLNLAKRKINFVDRGKQYHGLDKRGTIRLGKCLFTHGVRCGANAAKMTLDDVGDNIVFGHTHRLSSFIKTNVHGTLGAWSSGCLCEISPLYSDTNVTGWAHAYALQIVEPDGRFLMIQVPITNGRSMLSRLINIGG